jgi:hypothetical protein
MCTGNLIRLGQLNLVVRWTVHVACMYEMINGYNSLVEKISWKESTWET